MARNHSLSCSANTPQRVSEIDGLSEDKGHPQLGCTAMHFHIQYHLEDVLVWILMSMSWQSPNKTEIFQPVRY